MQNEHQKVTAKKPNLIQIIKHWFGIHSCLKLTDMVYYDGFARPRPTGTYTHICIVCLKEFDHAEE